MSYQVLARKWRPQTFDEVVGQDHITRTLKKAVEVERLSHAYMFSGPRGCGKTSTARILAKVINCTNLKKGNPCNECESCIGVVKGKNLDVMEIDGASHTGVNEVRDLQESLGYVPSQYANKVYIIDEVHMLSMHAFNALLKTLEEPPAHVYFIFATTAPHKIPDTIKSRCQRHQFKRLEIGEIAEHLEKICKAEKVKYEMDALRLLARKAEGSMRDGESLLDQCITASSGQVETKSVRDILGLLDQELVLEFLRTVAGGDSTAALKRLDQAIHEGVDLDELLHALIEGFRDTMLMASGGELSELIFRSKDEIESLKELLPSYELADLVTIVERLCNLEPRLKMAGDPRILFESTLVDLVLLDRQTDIRDLISRLEGSGGTGVQSKASKTVRTKRDGKDINTTPSPGLRRGESNAVPQPRTQPPAAPAAKAATVSSSGFQPATARDVDLTGVEYAELRKLWDGFVTVIRQKKVALGVCLISGNIQSVEGNVVTLRFAKGFSYQRDQVENESNKKFLKGMMNKYFGRDLELICLSEGNNLQTEREKLVRERKEQEASTRDMLEEKPLVKKILTDFDGEIVRHQPR